LLYFSLYFIFCILKTESQIHHMAYCCSMLTPYQSKWFGAPTGLVSAFYHPSAWALASTRFCCIWCVAIYLPYFNFILQLNPLKWIVSGPNHHYPLRWSIHLSILYFYISPANSSFNHEPFKQYTSHITLSFTQLLKSH